MKTLRGETVHRRGRRRKRNVAALTSQVPYSITGTENDCEIIGHALNAYDLADRTTCLVCGARIFCPGCTPKHPQDENAVPEYCPRHEESQVKYVL